MMLSSKDKEVMLRLIGKQEGLNLCGCSFMISNASASFEVILSRNEEEGSKDETARIFVYISGEFTEKNVRESIILSTFEALTRSGVYMKIGANRIKEI